MVQGIYISLENTAIKKNSMKIVYETLQVWYCYY